MIFACTQENLAQGLALVGHISGKNINLPILSHVLLKVEEGNLKLSATNLEMAVSALVRGRAEAIGECAVPAKLFQDYVGLLPSGKVELVLEGDVLEIRADGKVTKIKGMPATEFPLIPKLAKEGGYSVKAPLLRESINEAVFAVSSSDARPELSGVACFFRSTDRGTVCVMAATDSYRLAERTIGVEPVSGVFVETKCIVPARAMQEVARILSAYKDDVGMPEEAQWMLADNQMVFTYGKVELVSRLIEGSFPDYQQIIPQTFRTTFHVSRGELAKAVRAASLFSRQGLFDVHLELKESGELLVSSSDTGTGAHTTTLHVEGSDGQTNTVTLNYKYVTDGLAVCPQDAVTVKMIDAMNPIVFTPKEGDGFQYIVMPIRQ